MQQTTKAGKKSSVDENTNNAVDLADEDTPLINVAQSKGKKRMTSSTKSKDTGEGSSTKTGASLADHKLLKTVKQEK